MLTKEERAELEALKKDPDVKLAVKATYDKERQMLYKYRYLKKKGEKLAKEQEEREKNGKGD